MFDPNLITLTIASLKKAGITPTKLPARKQLHLEPAQSEVTAIATALADSQHDDPYTDPKVIALATKQYLSTLSTAINHAYNQDQRERQARTFEEQIPDLLDQLQTAFNTTAEQLVKDAAPIIDVPKLKDIDLSSAPKYIRHAVTDTLAGLYNLEAIIKAWQDIWAGQGKLNYTTRDGEAFKYMDATKPQWSTIRHNPTIWEAMRNGAKLTLAETPQQAGERFRIMANSEQLEHDRKQAKLHDAQGRRAAEFYQSGHTNNRK